MLPLAAGLGELQRDAQIRDAHWPAQPLSAAPEPSKNTCFKPQVEVLPASRARFASESANGSSDRDSRLSVGAGKWRSLARDNLLCERSCGREAMHPASMHQHPWPWFKAASNASSLIAPSSAQLIRSW
eukprot:scaffold529_cov308-Pinguiococcus_pyrenoidosus.AAC.1